ncbi:hypothetical protein [Brevundimonas sp.]|uniref:hypothetical protein n=1 Tax=Brevundimonas sp. TaxID=1871086 RepID=UPI001AC9D102|nr:hypothetical protein [Brevundimonas sp.]MBN9466437.1 hypothetical protein [Brevundimonas sp.]
MNAPSPLSDKQRIPPKAVADCAALGLMLREKHRRGGTEVGHARGLQLKNREPVSDRDIKSMYSYFARHEVDKRSLYWGMKDKPSAGYIAWLLWGGDPGRDWIEGLRDALRNAE